MLLNLSSSLFLSLAVIIFIWLLILSFFIFTSLRHYNRLTQGIAKKDLKSVLDQMLTQIGVCGEEIKKITLKLEELEKADKLHIQKVGLLRFNPFGDTGGDQSFVLALLDGHQDGVVISSLHSRSATRWYAKKIKDGKGEQHELSEEERKAIKLAKT